MRPGVKGTFTSTPASFAAFSTAAHAAENDQVGKRNLLAEFLLDRFELLQDRLELGRLVDLPVLLRRETNARAVRAAALVGAAERRRRRPGGGNKLRHRQAG